MWSPRRWSVWFGCLSLGLTESAQFSIGPVELISCSIQIHVELSA